MFREAFLKRKVTRELRQIFTMQNRVCSRIRGLRGVGEEDRVQGRCRVRSILLAGWFSSGLGIGGRVWVIFWRVCGRSRGSFLDVVGEEESIKIFEGKNHCGVQGRCFQQLQGEGRKRGYQPMGAGLVMAE